MKKFFVFWVLLAVAVPVFAQTRDDIHIYIPPVMSADPSQAKYFKDNFEMETAGAGYSLAHDSREADYTLQLEVQPNVILYDDGTTEPASPEEGLYQLQITLVRNEDDVEIVAFSFPFTELEDMYDYNLYLLYEAMANVPMTKPREEVEAEVIVQLPDDSWRNKWLYFRGSFDYPITFYGLIEPHWITQKEPESGQDPKLIPLDNEISPLPAVSIGAEFQYLNWMSTEINFNLSFGDPMSNAFVPTIMVEQKFIIKPASQAHLMIEPYLALSFPLNTSPDVIQFPLFGVGGGFQLSTKAGSAGGFFVDLNFLYYLDDVIKKQTIKTDYGPDQISYFRFVVGLGIGYKYGIMDRPRKDTAPASVPAPSSLIPPPPVSTESGIDDFETVEEFDSSGTDGDDWW